MPNLSYTIQNVTYLPVSHVSQSIHLCTYLFYNFLFLIQVLHCTFQTDQSSPWKMACFAFLIGSSDIFPSKEYKNWCDKCQNNSFAMQSITKFCIKGIKCDLNLVLEKKEKKNRWSIHSLSTQSHNSSHEHKGSAPAREK